jgi:hypothetical protein
MLRAWRNAILDALAHLLDVLAAGEHPYETAGIQAITQWSLHAFGL